MAAVVVLGGDGFCGWPCSLGLSDYGYDVIIIDNLSRRKIEIELGASSLTPIATIDDRILAWREVSGRRMRYINLDVSQDYDRLVDLFREVRPVAVVHFAEQRAAPYSMKSSWHKRFTVNNNVNASNNVMCAMIDADITDCHLVHMGTMGVYGYGSTRGATIPEGYLPVEIQVGDEKVTQVILHPTDPGSVYHMTKVLDQSMFYYYNKNDKLIITDLHQGIVWGTNTILTKKDARLINRFDYDGDYGTVLNRFLMQAAVGHPLTVHGTGGQTRAFIHISDTVRAILKVVEKPPAKGEKVRILNQMTETHKVRDLAALVAEMTGAKVEFWDNPRNEAPENELVVSNQCFTSLGFEPIKLASGLLEEIYEVARRYRGRCDFQRIPARSQWIRK